jgi:hypothetical protein
MKNCKCKGVDFLELLVLILVTLKLTDNIDLSWWLICSPIMISLVAYLFVNRD